MNTTYLCGGCLSDANPKNAFNIEKHLSTKLVLKPDDKYEVIEINLPD